jgi:hypothetical protein
VPKGLSYDAVVPRSLPGTGCNSDKTSSSSGSNSTGLDSSVDRSKGATDWEHDRIRNLDPGMSLQKGQSNDMASWDDDYAPGVQMRNVEVMLNLTSTVYPDLL